MTTQTTPHWAENTAHLDRVMKRSKQYIRGYLEAMWQTNADLRDYCNSLNRRLDRAKRRKN